MHCFIGNSALKSRLRFPATLFILLNLQKHFLIANRISFWISFIFFKINFYQFYVPGKHFLVQEADLKFATKAFQYSGYFNLNNAGIVLTAWALSVAG